MFNGDMGQRILFFKNALGYKCENVSQLSQDSWVVSKVSGMARSRVSKDTERTFLSHVPSPHWVFQWVSLIIAIVMISISDSW